MTMRKQSLLICLWTLGLYICLGATDRQNNADYHAPLVAADEFTLYELQPPETHQFAITYDVTAMREGAQFFFNPIRPGSVATKSA